MILTGLLPQTVAVVSYGDGAVDAYGNAARAETGRVSSPARMWQLSTKENITGRDTAADEWAAILPPSVVVAAGSQIEWNNRVFMVDGTPDVVYGMASPHHIELRLHYSGPVA